MAKTRKVQRGRTRRLRGPRKTQRGRGLFNSFLANKKPNLPTVVVENPAHGIKQRANLSRFNAYKTTVNPLRTRAAKSNVSQSPLTKMLNSNERVTAPSPVLSNKQPNASANASGQLSRNFMRKRLNNGENPNMTHLTRNPLREAVNLSYQIPGRYP